MEPIHYSRYTRRRNNSHFAHSKSITTINGLLGNKTPLPLDKCLSTEAIRGMDNWSASKQEILGNESFFSRNGPISIFLFARIMSPPWPKCRIFQNGFFFTKWSYFYCPISKNYESAMTQMPDSAKWLLIRSSVNGHP